MSIKFVAEYPSSLSDHTMNNSLGQHFRKDSKVNVKIPFFPNELSTALSVRKRKNEMFTSRKKKTTYNHKNTEILKVRGMHLSSSSLPVTKTEWRDDIFWICKRIMQER